MIQRYEDLNAHLYAGDVAACFRFLDERLATDGHHPEYLHWRAVTHLRAGQFLQALDLCFRLTRDGGNFAFHLHCMEDACVHLGLKEVGLAAIEAFAQKPSTHPLAAYLWRTYGWSYLGEDDRVLSQSHDGLDEHSQYVLGHHQARSRMRRDGIAQGVADMHRYWASDEARRVLFPQVDREHYWCGQRELPARISLTSVASGFGDMVNWARYLGALHAMGVAVDSDIAFFHLTTVDQHQAELAEQMQQAGFSRASGERHMWTDPFTLFTALFPAVGFMPARRYIEPIDPSCADALIDAIRHRARGRHCVGIFWSSCESPDNYARKSLCLPHLAPLFDDARDIYWVVMQRGFERTRWLNDPRSADQDRFTTIDADVTLNQSTALIDKLDAFVGNDGSLSHIAGALGKPCYLMLNQAADWRYERASDSTPWYPTMRLVRARSMGDWASIVDTLHGLLACDPR